MTKRTILAVVVLCGLAAPAAGRAMDEAPLAGRFPGHTVAYVGWAGQTLRFDESAFGQLLTSPLVQSLAGNIHELILADADDEAEAEAIEHVWEMADIAWRRPLAIGLIELSPPAQPPADEGDDVEVHCQAALLIDLGDMREPFDTHLQEFLAASGVSLETVMVAEEPCHSLPTPAGPIVFGYLEDLFFMTIGEGTAEMLAELSGNESLAVDDRFVQTVGDVRAGWRTAQAVVYVEIDSLRSIVESFLPPAPTPADYEDGVVGFEEEIFNPVGIHWLWWALGIDNATTFVAGLHFEGEAMRLETRLSTPAPHHGLLTLYDGRPLTDDDLAMVPADADYFSAFHFDPAAVYDEALRILNQMPTPPDEQAVYDTYMAEILPEIEEELGFALEEDLLDSVGDRWVLCSAPSYGGFLTGTVLIADVRDPAGLQHVIAQLESKVGGVQREDGPESPTTQPAERRGPPIQLAETMVGSTPVHYISRFLSGRGRPLPIPLAPAWAIHEDRLYAAAFPQVIETVLTRDEIVPITEDPRFQEMRSGLVLQDNVVAMEYLNSPKIAREAYNILLVVSTVLQNLPEDEFPLPVHWLRLPSLTALEDALSPEISVMVVDDNGIATEWYGQTPVSGVFGVAMASTAMIPALNEARDRAKTAVSLANLNAIGKAAMLYAVENNDQWPDDFMDLINANIISASHLHSRRSHGPPPQIVDGQLVGEVGYVYIKPAEEWDQADTSLILAYERPEYYRGAGTCVLHVGGSVQWMDMSEFTVLLQRTRAAHAQADR